MIDDTQFREVYSAVAGQLGMGRVDSAEYLRLLHEWHQGGRDSDILEFLYRRAKTTDMPIIDPSPQS